MPEENVTSDKTFISKSSLTDAVSEKVIAADPSKPRVILSVASPLNLNSLAIVVALVSGL